MGCTGPCGDLERPPSRSNMSIFAIIELVVMAVCGILALQQLIDIFNDKTTDLGNAWTLVTVIIDIVIVVGLVLVIIGLFFSTSSNSIRSGILCFLFGAIASVVLIVYKIVKGDRLTFQNLCFIILLIFLSYILWRQSGHL